MESAENREILNLLLKISKKLLGKEKTNVFSLILILIIVVSFILTTGIYYYISPTNHEMVSHLNSPSFPLHNLSINIPDGIDMDCEIVFNNYKKPYPCPKNKSIIYIKEVINKTPIIEPEGRLIIKFFVNDKDYKKMEGKILKIKYDIYSFDKNYKIKNHNIGRNYHLDNMIKTSNERKETKFFYYDIKSYRINNEGDIYDFSILNSDETVRYFTWENSFFTKYGCNFVVYLTKADFFQLTERKRTNYIIILLLAFSFLISLCDFIATCLRKKKEENRDRLIANERSPNNDNNATGINIELEEH